VFLLMSDDSAAGAGGVLAARPAALSSYVGQVASAEPAQRLAETKRQPVTKAKRSCEGGEGGRERMRERGRVTERG